MERAFRRVRFFFFSIEATNLSKARKGGREEEETSRVRESLLARRSFQRSIASCAIDFTQIRDTADVSGDVSRCIVQWPQGELPLRF